MKKLSWQNGPVDKMVMLMKWLLTKRLVANAINVLQACIYKSVKTGIFIKSFVDPNVVYFQIVMLFC